MAVAIVTVVLVAAVALLVWERIPVDLTAIGIMVVLALTGLLTPAEAVAGFANPAVVTVGAMFLLSAGMVRTGAVGFVARLVIRSARDSHRRAMLTTVVVVAVASAFINNTPIVVLFVPIVMSLSCEYDMSPSKFLIPLSFASILGGTCTLIGTSTNIILSDLSIERGLGGIGMFELATLGVPIAVVGLAYLCLAAPRLLPGHATPTCEVDDRKDRRYLAELRVTDGGSLVGKDPFESLVDRFAAFEVFELVRQGQIIHPEAGRRHAAAGDVILAKGSPNHFVTLLNEGSVELPHALDGSLVSQSNAEHVVAELIIPPQSSLVGQRLAGSTLAREPDLDIIAVRKRGLHYSEQKMGSLRLRIGTILLVQCSPGRLEALRTSPEVIVVEEVHGEIVRKDRAWRALTIFAGVVIAAASGLVDILVAALAGAFLMVLTRCVSLRDAYRAVQGQVLVLIVGTIALGTAMEQTGAAELYAGGLLALLEGAGPRVVLSAIILLTSVGTLMLSNNATAVLLFPIAVSTALAMDASPRPFIVAVCFGASAAFASPIGYQTNLLVYGPGGYRFADFLKVGLPLNVLIWAMGTAFIPMIWPF